jgi:hypothetical protein
MIVAIIALVMALGGTSYAALSIPKNSVGSKQLKKNAVTTKKIKNGAVTTAKIKNHAVTAEKINPTGLSAQAVAYVHVEANGTLDTSHSKNVSASSLTATGVYCLKVSVPVVSVTGAADAESTGNFASVSAVMGGQDPHNYIGTFCPSGDNVIIGEMDGSGNNVDAGFWLSFN